MYSTDAVYLPVSRGPGVKFDRIHENEFMEDTAWPENNTTLVIFANRDGKKTKFRAVKSAGYLDQFRDGDTVDMVHDQNGVRQTGWEVAANIKNPRDAFQLGSGTRNYLNARLMHRFGTDLDKARFSLAVFK